MKNLKRFLISIIVVFALCSTAFGDGSQQTSGVTAQTIIDQARYYANEVTASFWSNTPEVLFWVNNGIRDIASKTKCLEHSNIITLTSGQTEYAISSGSTKYIGIDSVIYASGASGSETYKGLVRSNPQSTGHVSNPLQPVYFYEFGGKIGLIPTPGSAQTGTSIYVNFTSIPSGITITQEVQLPGGGAYTDLLSMYVAAKMLFRSGKFNEGSLLMNQYYPGLVQMRKDYTQPQKVGLQEIIKK